MNAHREVMVPLEHHSVAGWPYQENDNPHPRLHNNTFSSSFDIAIQNEQKAISHKCSNLLEKSIDSEGSNERREHLIKGQSRFTELHCVLTLMIIVAAYVFSPSGCVRA